MIADQSSIRVLFDDVDNELSFIDYMIEKKYKQAFDLCCAVYNVYTNEVFIQNVLDYIYPELRKEQAEFSMLVKNLCINDFVFEEKLVMKQYNQLATLQHIIFD